MGREDVDTDEGDRAYVGAALLAEAVRELRTIREILIQVHGKG